MSVQLPPRHAAAQTCPPAQQDQPLLLDRRSADKPFQDEQPGLTAASGFESALADHAHSCLPDGAAPTAQMPMSRSTVAERASSKEPKMAHSTAQSGATYWEKVDQPGDALPAWPLEHHSKHLDWWWRQSSEDGKIRARHVFK